MRSRALAALLFCWSVVAPSLVAAGEPSPRERCLLDALRASRDETTVGEVRSRCEAASAGPTAAPTTAGVGAEAPAAPPAAAPPSAADIDAVGATTSLIEARRERESNLWSQRLSILPHRPNFFLPLAYSPDVAGTAGGTRLQSTEFKFQLSFKVALLDPVGRRGLNAWFAYTGQSWWQAYNSDRSSPFREYNHEPELFLSQAVDWSLGRWALRSISGGFVHQSNGRQPPVSRSWNRLFAEFQFDHPSRWWLTLRPWVRVRERNKSDPADAAGDDNPDISRYLGNGEVRFGYAGDRWRVSAMVRRSTQSGGKGAFQLDITHPTGFSPLVRWYLQYFDGYGESLVDYDRRVSRIGLGLMLNDWY